MNDTVAKYLTVQIGDQLCGIHVTQIIEIVHFMAFKSVPTQRDDILGFITVRNQVMPLIDMRIRFGIPNPAYKLDTPIVALRAAHGPIALIVDEAHQVEDIHIAHISPLQDSGQFPDIDAVTKLRDQLLLLLETDDLSMAIHATSDTVPS